jgi:hypothetical protein
MENVLLANPWFPLQAYIFRPKGRGITPKLLIKKVPPQGAGYGKRFARKPLVSIASLYFPPQGAGNYTQIIIKKYESLRAKIRTVFKKLETSHFIVVKDPKKRDFYINNNFEKSPLFSDILP